LKVVIKVGGSLLKEGLPAPLIEDIKGVSSSHSLILVHGGGDIVTDVANKLGKEQRFVTSPEGIRSRYTDEETAGIYQMVMTGKVAKSLVMALSAAGINAVSVSGTDGRLMVGKRKKKLVIVDDRNRKVIIDGGYTGKVESVNAGLLELLVKNGYVPLVSPVAMGEQGEALNVDGDRAAAAIATGVRADRVLFLTNVEGLLLGGKLVEKLSPDEAEADLPQVGFGMQKKVLASIDAVRGGVREAIICSGRREKPLTMAMAHVGCTVIS
jgi:acetylglutamate/LysW-gamma-L-alpha-aminoadipate kinase